MSVAVLLVGRLYYYSTSAARFGIGGLSGGMEAGFIDRRPHTRGSGWWDGGAASTCLATGGTNTPGAHRSGPDLECGHMMG